MKSGSPLFGQIDKSIDKKMNLFSNNFPRCAVRVMLACLFLTLGTVVVFAVAIKGEGISHGLGEMLYTPMFNWLLVMILYMNAELGTSNTSYITIGIYHKRVNFSLAAKILFAYTLFNLVGGVLFGFLVSLTVPPQDLPRDSFLFISIAGKLEKTTLQVLIEAIFTNIVVNTAMLVSIRMEDDTGKVAAIIFIIFIFTFLGFERVIVNFPASNLTYFASDDAIEAFTAGNIVHNLFWALIDNFIGNGLVMNLGYAWLDKDNKNLTHPD